EGPWGAFVAVEVAAGDDLRASLLAPWEGRAAPSRAERELLSLLGQNAAIAMEHALLVEQLRAQTEELNRMASVQSDFLRGVTHDLQTPLTRVSALAAEVGEQPQLSEASRADLGAGRPFQLEVAGIPHLVVADPDRFEQVLWALLDNAVKYSPAGSAVAVRLSGDRAAARELQSVIQIRDEGSGMDEEAQARA